MPKRKHKKYRKPKTPFDRERIKEEEILVKKYGLKNKKEIWKADSAIGKIRRQAKLLLTKEPREQEKFINRLKKVGLTVDNIADVLALDKEDYLKRRLQSIVTKKKIASTPKQARQFIVHKHVTINGKIINVPSYVIKTQEEDQIDLVLVKKNKPEKKEIVKKVLEGAENA
jgi:small subunit ribosomal protein S4